MIIRIEMASFNQLAMIFRENKLVGCNCVVWKTNWTFLLTAEEYEYVLSLNFAQRNLLRGYIIGKWANHQWVKADEMA